MKLLIIIFLLSCASCATRAPLAAGQPKGYPNVCIDSKQKNPHKHSKIKKRNKSQPKWYR